MARNCHSEVTVLVAQDYTKKAKVEEEGGEAVDRKAGWGPGSE